MISTGCWSPESESVCEAGAVHPGAASSKRTGATKVFLIRGLLSGADAADRRKFDFERVPAAEKRFSCAFPYYHAGGRRARIAVTNRAGTGETPAPRASHPSSSGTLHGAVARLRAASRRESGEPPPGHRRTPPRPESPAACSESTQASSTLLREIIRRFRDLVS